MKGKKESLGEGIMEELEIIGVVFVFALSGVLPLILFISLFSNSLGLIKVVLFGFFSGVLAISFMEYALNDYVKNSKRRR